MIWHSFFPPTVHNKIINFNFVSIKINLNLPVVLVKNKSSVVFVQLAEFFHFVGRQDKVEHLIGFTPADKENVAGVDMLKIGICID
jgi:hypothetical protein